MNIGATAAIATLVPAKIGGLPFEIDPSWMKPLPETNWGRQAHKFVPT